MGPSAGGPLPHARGHRRSVPTRHPSEGNVEAVDEAHIAVYERGTCAREARRQQH